MELWKHGPLIGAAIYVVAVLVLISGRPDALPPEVEASLELRQLAFFARIVPGDNRADDTSDVQPWMVAAAEPLARRAFPTSIDRYRGAALAARLGARELIPLFVAPLASTEPAAAGLVAWAFDPAPVRTPADLAVLRSTGIPPLEAEALVQWVARTSGLTAEADAARDALAADRQAVLNFGLLGLLLMIGVFGVGLRYWYLARRWVPGGAAEPPRADWILPPVRVVVYFLALFVSVWTLVPELIDRWGRVVEPLTLVVALYLCVGVGSLLLVALVGGRRPGETLRELFGLAGSFRPSRFVATVREAGIAWCMAWPAFFGATVVTLIMIGPGSPTPDPVSQFLVVRPDEQSIAVLLATLGVLAPLFEEPLFRGFLYRRLRRRMPPAAAAAISGLAFGAAHLSASHLLPLAALGFTLALVYVKTRDLATPRLVHSLWNLVNALLLLAVFS